MRKMRLMALLCLFATSVYGQKISDTNKGSDSVRVFVSFIAEIDGSITKIKVDKIECKNCSKEIEKRIGDEAVRAIKQMPKLNDHKKRTKYVLPIKFKLED